MIAGEALILTSGGIISGLGLGYFFHTMILRLLKKQQAFPVMELSLTHMVAGIALISGFFVLLGVIAALIPGIRSVKIDPSSAMAQGDID
jgi:ABC-type antimicrobial peptide transport system permease subunit